MKTIEISDSKSIANRLLILSSFSSGLQVNVNSQATDVLDLQVALNNLSGGQFSIEHGGTSLRFLLARLSRKCGTFYVKVGTRLRSRPHGALLDGLRQLGAFVEELENGYVVKSDGWKNYEVEVDCAQSSQYLSALLLSSIHLSESVSFLLLNRGLSESYLQLTIDLLKTCGIEILDFGDRIVVPSGQSLKRLAPCEPDMSSAFSAAAIACVSEPLRIANFPKESVQPDYRFIEVLEKFGIRLAFSDGLVVYPSPILYDCQVSLEQSPDLFPVLCALIACNERKVRLTGLDLLPYKESDRLQKTIELLQLAGIRSVNRQKGYLELSGPIDKERQFVFDPDMDHRMAMAAAVLKKAGCDIEIYRPEVVDKSYPGFWTDFF